MPSACMKWNGNGPHTLLIPELAVSFLAGGPAEGNHDSLRAGDKSLRPEIEALAAGPGSQCAH
jgi:hypothetical protein